MTPAALAVLIVSGILLVGLPRRWAAVPLLAAAAYTPRVPVVMLGPANLSILRVLVVLGIVRAVVRHEGFAGGLNRVDVLLLTWAALLIGTSAFHTSDTWTFRLGLVLGEVGVYSLCRVFLQDVEDVKRLFRVLCLVLAPLAILMLIEKWTAYNYFAVVGQFSAVTVRNGNARAAGPFAHAILAGTIGAMCVPMALSGWKSHRFSALAGVFVGLAIVYASTSSGPVLTLILMCGGVLVWKVRWALSLLRWAGILAIIGLQIVMNDPVYFLMARVDLVGGSTGWYRAQLIRSSIQHLNEWWLWGTDLTRHWMPTGIPANDNSADMTNHFLQVGVWGGLPLLILFVLTLWAAFGKIGSALRAAEDAAPETRFVMWTVGVMLLGHIATFFSISLYDQSASYYYLSLAAVGALACPAKSIAPERVATSPVGQRRGAPQARTEPVSVARPAWPRRAARPEAVGHSRSRWVDGRHRQKLANRTNS